MSYSFHDACATLTYRYELAKCPPPERDPLDADQLAALDAHPLHERKWGFGR